MPEQNKPFVVTDRRKFSHGWDTASGCRARSVGELECEPGAPDWPHARVCRAGCFGAAICGNGGGVGAPAGSNQTCLAPPTEQEMDQANAAYQQTSERLDTAVRAANPGMDHPPPMSFEQIVQSIFMSALMQLGATAPKGSSPEWI